MKKKLIYIFLFCTPTLFAQKTGESGKTNETEAIEEALEFIQQDREQENVNAEYLYDLLLGYMQSPLYLNHEKELDEFPLLNPIQKKELLKYREKNGDILSWNELVRVEGYDIKLVQMLRNFTTIESKSALDTEQNWKAMWNEGKTEFSFGYRSELIKRAGFIARNDTTSPKYPGPAFRYYHRIRKQLPGKYSIGWVAERDPGEKSTFDFNTAHAFLKQDRGIIRTITIGDYQLHHGQDLVIAPAFTLSKSSNVLTMHRTGPSIRPNTSVDEQLFLRGGAVQLIKNNISLNIFASSNKMDGIIDSTKKAILSRRFTGLHRSESEVAGKDQLKINTAGAFAEYQSRKWKVGASFVAYQWQGVDPSFKEETQNTAGVSYSFQLPNGLFYGETAVKLNNQAIATVNGLLLSIGNDLNFGAIYRNYSPEYNHYFANGFSGGSFTQNEQGLMAGFELKPRKFLVISTYIDQYHHPATKFDSYAPSINRDLFTQVRFLKKRKWEVYARYRLRIDQEEEFEPEVTKAEQPLELTKQNFRLHAEFRVTKEIKIRSRIEMLFNENKSGILIYQDVIWHPLKLPVSVEMRLALFDTDSFDERIYAYENNVPYTFSVPAHYYKGSRKYIQVRYNPTHYIDIFARYSIFSYRNQSTISSGDELIDSNKKEEISLIARIKF